MIMRSGGTVPEPPAPPRPLQAPQPPRARETLEPELYSDNYAHKLRSSAPDVTPHNVPAPPEPPRFDRSLYEPPPASEASSYTMIIGKGAAPVPPVLGMDGSAGYAAPPPPAPPTAPQAAAKPTSKTPLIVALVLVLAILAALILFLLLRAAG
jgi:hypothetical protein